MLTKEERKEINTEFWANFKAFSKKHKGIRTKQINWINYPTYVKQLYIRLTCDTESARFAIEIQDKDEGIRDLIWDQLEELKKVLEKEMIEPGVWEKKAFNIAGHSISRISWTLPGVSYLSKKDEEKIFPFFMQYLVRFDKFYSEYDEILISLTH
ncbi:MAG: DUF4268 domain-containing protein [Brumimicrobium sp.]|nr:DUF4268 domain-containing protein [Brumimicrobium sp.]